MTSKRPLPGELEPTAWGGGVLMAYGGQRVQITQIGPRAFAARIRF